MPVHWLSPKTGGPVNAGTAKAHTNTVAQISTGSLKIRWLLLVTTAVIQITHPTDRGVILPTDPPDGSTVMCQDVKVNERLIQPRSQNQRTGGGAIAVSEGAH